MTDTIEVHQALHGYAGGHRLLQASVALPMPVQRTLVILSDLSGSNTVPGFDTYLTGYPLMGTDLFALARTWYAPEMERPGCVWTHTLLIRYADLDVIEDCRVLNSLFRRPRLNEPTTDYGRPVALSSCATLGPPNLDVRVGSEVLRGLYETADRAVFVPCGTASEADELFLRLWSQQWPGLRRRFLFCTGALANRELGGSPFDLQAVPHGLLRDVRREVASAYVVTQEHATSVTTTSSDWLDAAVLDLQLSGLGSLGRFMLAAAPPDAGRESFIDLAQAQQDASHLDGSVESFVRLLESLAKRCPLPTTGERLKRILLAGKLPVSLAVQLPSEPLALRVFATSAVSAAYDAASLQLRERAGQLWRDNGTDAMNLLTWLLNASLNTLGEEILRGLVGAIGSREIDVICRDAARIVPTLVASNPLLATHATVWQVMPDRQREIVDSLAAAGPNAVGKDVVFAALSANAEAAADGLARLMGLEIVTTLLEWVDHHPSSPIGRQHGDRWMRLLAANANSLLNWLSHVDHLEAETLALATKVLDPHSASVRTVGAEFWLRLMGVISGELAWPSSVRLRSFCMAVALDNSGPGSDQLATGSFEVLHTAAARDDIPYDDWQLFQNKLPTLSWWQRWDCCERLRRGIIAAFIRYHWPAHTVLYSTSDETVFAALIGSALEVDYGERFFRKLADAVRLNQIIAPEPQRSVLLRSA